MAKTNQTETTFCHGCGGDMPAYEIWEANRNQAGDCDGSIDCKGRCRAWSDDELWTVEQDDED